MAGQDAVLQLLSALVNELKVSLTSRIDTLLEKIQKNEEDNKLMKNLITQTTEQVENNTKEIKEIKLKMEEQCLKNTQQTQPINPIQTTQNTTKERGIRRNNLIITGLNITDEDTKTALENFLKIHFPGVKSEILAVQTINSRGTDSPRYLFTLKSCWDAQLIYNQRVMNLKDHKIYISEDLTVNESRLFYKARQLRKDKLIHSTWTKEGKTYIKLAIGKEPRELNEDDPLLNQLTNMQRASITNAEKPSDANDMTTQAREEEKGTSHTQHNLHQSKELMELIEAALTQSPTPSTSTNVQLQRSISHHTPPSTTPYTPSSATSSKTGNEFTADSTEDLKDLIEGAITRAAEKQKRKKTNKQNQ